MAEIAKWFFSWLFTFFFLFTHFETCVTSKSSFRLSATMEFLSFAKLCTAQKIWFLDETDVQELPAPTTRSRYIILADQAN